MSSEKSSQADWAHPDCFARRHIGPRPEEMEEMARACGFQSVAAFIEAAVPENIRSSKPLNLPPALGEAQALAGLRALASQNQIFRSYLGMGYYDCITPPVIQRNIFENPAWYTPYTPYQAEISQGRLEMLLNFQTMVCELTGLEVANASLLDEPTAAAEAMMLCHRVKDAEGTHVFFVSDTCHPRTIEVVKTRAKALGIEIAVGDFRAFQFHQKVCGALVQYPATNGQIHDYSDFAKKAHDAGALVVVAADLLSLTLLRPPAEFGADVAVGSAQRFGVPMGYGGPHAAFFATRDSLKRQMPGRLVGISRDSRGRPALRLALGTREQHIRREKATSNICTAQALLATMAAAYAIYHGPDGLRQIAAYLHSLACALADGLLRLGHTVSDGPWFDTLQIRLHRGSTDELCRIAARHKVNLRIFDSQTVGVALDETTTPGDILTLLQIFNDDKPVDFTLEKPEPAIPPQHRRTSPFMTQPVFNRYHSELEMARYLQRLQARDFSLCHGMIPLGSCTMKLNAAVEMLPLSWPELARLHPFAPPEQARGYHEMFRQLEQWLAEITGMAAVSLQPNAGSQGEYTGLLVIRQYHQSRGEGHRNICLIPSSAHGTNPASAVMAGLKVISVACDSHGNVDLRDLRAKAESNSANLACMMITYPSTHGVFEKAIREICQIIHANGGLVYMDGANMNAQVGLCSPGDLGADVCHLNLHKTFAIPHGGGGPGMGPIAVTSKLAPFLPERSASTNAAQQPVGPVAGAPYGSASILSISWVYIAAMGAAGLLQATQAAILNANYISKRLEPYFPTLYKGPTGLVAHECILDLRRFKHTTAEDVAKRLMDFGFHAPTLSWPVAGTLMVEPTESESKAELDRFCDAMIAIHAEMMAVETGQIDRTDNPLKNAPHTADMLADDWSHPYPRRQAAFPAPWTLEWKFWPAVGRVDNVYGDRNLVCTCANWPA